MSLEARDPGVRSERTWIEACLIWAATAMIAAAVMNAAPLQSANDRSRWATVWSLVERRTFQIDEIDSNPRWSTIDKVRYRANDAEPWHFYSSKPPLLSMIVASLYAIERATIGLDLLKQTPFVTRLLLLIVNVIPFWFALRSLSRTLSLLGCVLPIRVFVLIAAGFGSIINPYLTTLNNHTPAAVCAMFAIAAAVRIILTRKSGKVESVQPRSRDFAALGFFAALTCCFELPAAQLSVLAFVLSVSVSVRATAKWFIPAAAIPLAAFFITNWMVTGGAKPFYATYGTETYEYVHNGIPSYWKNPKDLDANQEHPIVYLFHCVLGHHGLISLTPFLAISLVGVFLALKRSESTSAGKAVSASVSDASVTRSALRAIVLSGALMTVITLGFYLTRTQNYNYGGNSVGLRWMLWLSPFWWIALVPALSVVNRRGTQVICTILLSVSVASAIWSIDRPWKASWLYEHLELAGLINYRTSVKPFDRPRGSVIGLISKTRASAEFQSTDQQTAKFTIDGETVTLEIQPARLQQGTDSENIQTVSFPFDRGRWDRSGMVRCAPPTADPAIRFAEMFLTGFSPHLCKINRKQFDADQFPAYQATGDRWVPSKSKPESAWHVERGVARIIEKSSLHGDLMHRCEVWYCDDAPFGVIQWRTTVTSMASGEILDAVTWTWSEL